LILFTFMMFSLTPFSFPLCCFISNASAESQESKKGGE
jgi:hypothetical protein